MDVFFGGRAMSRNMARLAGRLKAGAGGNALASSELGELLG